jgi:hypothetical protein
MRSISLSAGAGRRRNRRGARLHILERAPGAGGVGGGGEGVLEDALRLVVAGAVDEGRILLAGEFVGDLSPSQPRRRSWRPRAASASPSGRHRARGPGSPTCRSGACRSGAGALSPIQAASPSPLSIGPFEAVGADRDDVGELPHRRRFVDLLDHPAGDIGGDPIAAARIARRPAWSPPSPRGGDSCRGRPCIRRGSRPNNRTCR